MVKKLLSRDIDLVIVYNLTKRENVYWLVPYAFAKSVITERQKKKDHDDYVIIHCDKYIYYDDYACD